MADPTGKEGSTIAAKIVLGFVFINLLFLLTELALNVFGALLPL